MKIWGLFDFFKSTSRTDELLQQYQQQTTAAQGTIRGQLLIVEDVFSIKGRGTVVTGTALAPITVGQHVTIQRTDGTSYTSTITGVEASNESLQTVNPGDDVGIMFADIDRNQVASGDRVIVV